MRRGCFEPHPHSFESHVFVDCISKAGNLADIMGRVPRVFEINTHRRLEAKSSASAGMDIGSPLRLSSS